MGAEKGSSSGGSGASREIIIWGSVGEVGGNWKGRKEPTCANVNVGVYLGMFWSG